jgi:hypothetical protein
VDEIPRSSFCSRTFINNFFDKPFEVARVLLSGLTFFQKFQKFVGLERIFQQRFLWRGKKINQNVFLQFFVFLAGKETNHCSNSTFVENLNKFLKF